MSSLAEQSEYVRMALLTVLFVLQLLWFCAAALETVQKNRNKYLIVPAVFFVINGVLFNLLADGNRSLLQQQEIKPPALGALSVPLPVLYLYLLVSGFILVRIFLREQAYRKNSISDNSVKESIDTLEEGLCFSSENGRILLANHRMEELCQRITGSDLQDGKAFWKALTEGEFSGRAERLAGEEHITLMLSDRSVWRFARKQMKVESEMVQQLRAADVTALYQMTLCLREENRKAADLNERLHLYDRNIAGLTRMKEQLDARVRIHDEFGQVLLAARHCLTRETHTKISGEEADAVLEAWRRNIAILQQKEKPKKKQPAIRQLKEAAGSVGIQLVLEGTLPGDGNCERILAGAAAEALTNAAIHAKAGLLKIRSEKTKEGWSVLFTNDGIPPKEEITEGGGLGLLRRRIEGLGGRMEVRAKPFFSLRIDIPEEVEVNPFV